MWRDLFPWIGRVQSTNKFWVFGNRCNVFALYCSLMNSITPGWSANRKLGAPTENGCSASANWRLGGVVRYIEFKLLHAMVYVSLPESLLSSLHLRPPCPLSGCDFPTGCCQHGALRF